MVAYGKSQPISHVSAAPIDARMATTRLGARRPATQSGLIVSPRGALSRPDRVYLGRAHD